MRPELYIEGKDHVWPGIVNKCHGGERFTKHELHLCYPKQRLVVIARIKATQSQPICPCVH